MKRTIISDMTPEQATDELTMMEIRKLLVFETFEKAVKANPNAHPIFHSDRGF